MDTGTCKYCKLTKPKECFYPSTKFRICKDCGREIDKKRHQRELIKSGGGFKIYSQPNKYANDIQKNLVFRFMEKMGWEFNINNNIWFKENVKDKEGNFLILKKYKKVYRTNKLTNEEKEIIEKELIQKIIKLRNDNKNYKEIAKEVGVSIPTVYKKIKNYYGSH